MNLTKAFSSVTRAFSNDSSLRQRYEPTGAYMLAQHLRDEGVELSEVDGPWHVGAMTLPRKGRHRMTLIPLVTNGHTEMMVDTLEHAIDVSGLLNWCGVDELNPVPDLTPPKLEEA